LHISIVRKFSIVYSWIDLFKSQKYKQYACVPEFVKKFRAGKVPENAETCIEVFCAPISGLAKKGQTPHISFGKHDTHTTPQGSPE